MNEKQSRLEALKKKKEQLNARIQKLESLKKSRERKRDTRRKILVGSYFIDKANREGTLFDLYQKMDQYIKRNADRELFFLDPNTQCMINSICEKQLDLYCNEYRYFSRFLQMILRMKL